jgi:thermostable 8-oxoguanine DNA glycosylase
MLSLAYLRELLQRATNKKIEAYAAMARAETAITISSSDDTISALKEAQVRFEKAQSQYLKMTNDLVAAYKTGQIVT